MRDAYGCTESSGRHVTLTTEPRCPGLHGTSSASLDAKGVASFDPKLQLRLPPELLETPIKLRFAPKEGDPALQVQSLTLNLTPNLTLTLAPSPTLSPTLTLALTLPLTLPCRRSQWRRGSTSFPAVSPQRSSSLGSPRCAAWSALPARAARAPRSDTSSNLSLTLILTLTLTPTPTHP